MKFHGELQLTVKAQIIVEAKDMAAAIEICKDVSVSLDEPDGVRFPEWDVEPRAVYLFDGEE